MSEKQIQVEILKADHRYPSGYYYPLDEVKRVFDPEGKFMQRVKAGALRGEYGQPKQGVAESADAYQKRAFQIDESRVSHLIDNVQVSDTGVVTATVKPTGVLGDKWVNQLSQQKPRLAMRAAMGVQRDKETGNIVPIPGTMDIITFDIVSFEEVKAAQRMNFMKNSYTARDRKVMVLTKKEKALRLGHPRNNSGRPGDIAIAGVNINQLKGKPMPWPIGRTFPVFRCCKDGSWMKIGSIGEWFGAPPGTPEDVIEVYPNPSGTVYEEMLGSHWSEITHRKYFGDYDGNNGCVKVEDYLIAHYLTIPIPRRAAQRSRIRNLGIKLEEIDRLDLTLKATMERKP